MDRVASLYEITRDAVAKRWASTHVRGEDLEPAGRTIVLACVLEAERHPVLVHFPPSDSAPLEFDHLRLQGTVLFRGMQLEGRHAHGRYYVALLPRVARAMRKHDVAVPAEFPR